MPTKQRGKRTLRVGTKETTRVRDMGTSYGWTPCGFTVLGAGALEISAPRSSSRGSSLGLRFDSPASAIEHIKTGLDFGFLERLSKELQVTLQELAGIASIAKRTLARRKQEGRLKALESEKVYRIAALFDSAVEVLGGAEQARQWFKTPKKALRGYTPLQHVDTEVGAREVEDLLGRLEHGVFS